MQILVTYGLGQTPAKSKKMGEGKGKGKKALLSSGIHFFWQTFLQTSLVIGVAMKRADVK